MLFCFFLEVLPNRIDPNWTRLRLNWTQQNLDWWKETTMDGGINTDNQKAQLEKIFFKVSSTDVGSVTTFTGWNMRWIELCMKYILYFPDCFSTFLTVSSLLLITSSPRSWLMVIYNSLHNTKWAMDIQTDTVISISCCVWMIFSDGIYILVEVQNQIKL